MSKGVKRFTEKPGRLLLTAHCSLLTAHCSLLTTHDSRLTTDSLLTHYALVHREAGSLALRLCRDQQVDALRRHEHGHCLLAEAKHEVARQLALRLVTARVQARVRVRVRGRGRVAARPPPAAGAALHGTGGRIGLQPLLFMVAGSPSACSAPSAASKRLWPGGLTSGLLASTTASLGSIW